MMNATERRRFRRQPNAGVIPEEVVTVVEEVPAEIVALSELDRRLGLLDGLPAGWVSPGLRRSVVEAERARALVADHAARLEAVVADLDGALTADPADLDAAERAAGRVRALELVGSRLPEPALDSVAVTEALAAAESALAAAANVATIGPPSYVLEREAWRALGPNALHVEPPVATPDDLEAERQFRAILASGERLAADIGVWQRDSTQTDPVAALSAAGGLLGQLTAACAAAVEAGAQFRRVDARRCELGLRWQAPDVVRPRDRLPGQPPRIIVR